MSMSITDHCTNKDALQVIMSESKDMDKACGNHCSQYWCSHRISCHISGKQVVNHTFVCMNHEPFSIDKKMIKNNFILIPFTVLLKKLQSDQSESSLVNLCGVCVHWQFPNLPNLFSAAQTKPARRVITPVSIPCSHWISAASKPCPARSASKNGIDDQSQSPGQICQVKSLNHFSIWKNASVLLQNSTLANFSLSLSWKITDICLHTAAALPESNHN